jgi:hypothetical protein
MLRHASKSLRTRNMHEDGANVPPHNSLVTEHSQCPSANLDRDFRLGKCRLASALTLLGFALSIIFIRTSNYLPSTLLGASISYFVSINPPSCTHKCVHHLFNVPYCVLTRQMSNYELSFIPLCSCSFLGKFKSNTAPHAAPL